RSTLDLFGKGFTLLVLSSQGIDGSAFTDAARQAGLPLDIVSLDELQVRRYTSAPWFWFVPTGTWHGAAMRCPPMLQKSLIKCVAPGNNIFQHSITPLLALSFFSRCSFIPSMV